MRTFAFDLVVTRNLTDDAGADLLFDHFAGDVAPAVLDGAPRLLCTVAAPSFVLAVRRTLRRLRAAGVEVLRLEIEPEAVSA